MPGQKMTKSPSEGVGTNWRRPSHSRGPPRLTQGPRRAPRAPADRGPWGFGVVVSSDHRSGSWPLRTPRALSWHLGECPEQGRGFRCT